MNQVQSAVVCSGAQATPCNWKVWPGGVVKYRRTGTWSTEDISLFTAYRQQWVDATGGRITFKTSDDADRLLISIGSGCGLNGVGYEPGGGQTLQISRNDAYCSLHDMGHSIGLSHEHQRSDRDRYVAVDMSDLTQDSCHTAWNTCSAATATDYGIYNSESIMTYSSYINDDPNNVRFLEHRDDGSDIPLPTVIHPQDGSKVLEQYAEGEWNWSKFRPLGAYVSATNKLDNKLASGVPPAPGTSPAVSSQFSGALDVFVRGTDGKLYHRYCTGSCAATTGTSARLANWLPATGWNLVPNDGGPNHLGSPSSVSWGAGRVDLVSLRTDENVWLKSFESNQWYGWGSMGAPPGGAVSSPTIASRTNGTLEVLVRGADQSLYRKSWPDAWGSWIRQSGVSGKTMVADPVAVATSATTIDVAVVTTDGGIYLRTGTVSGSTWSWTTWSLVSNGVTSIHRVALASQGAGKLDLFARSVDDHTVHHTYRTSAAGPWSGWFALGGLLSGGPAAKARDGHIDVFGIDLETLPHAESMRGVRYRQWPK